MHFLGKCILWKVQGPSDLENENSWSKYLQANEGGLPAFTPAVSLTLLSAGLCRLARAEVAPFFQSENTKGPTWVTPREMLRDVGEEAQIQTGHGCVCAHMGQDTRKSLTQVIHEEEGTHSSFLVLSHFALHPPDASM